MLIINTIRNITIESKKHNFSQYIVKSNSNSIHKYEFNIFLTE